MEMNMRHFLPITFVVLLATAPAALAQKWEVGLGGGGSFYTSQSFTNPAGNASGKLASGFILSGWLGNNSGKTWGGELHYDFEKSDLKLSSGSTNVNFGAHTNAIHYDAVLNFASKEARMSPFISAGGGVKVYSGTGKEQAFQPLSNIALLTKTSQLEPLVSVGGGVKFNLTSATQFRIEAHDYLTPFPSKVIAPSLGSKVGGWLSDLVVMAGISFTF
jgi:Outer membrane protein beta-barrel domain